MSRRILVTSALPYANGHIHIGHLVEYLQTDIWVRFQKLTGRRCIYICADDTHGTAIMIRARDEGIAEQALIDRMQEAHRRDFAGFGIEFDHYGSTNSQETHLVCEEIWQALRRADMIRQREVTQLYDSVAGTFLADRFVKGTCPSCGLKNQYGDSCDNGHHYSPTELIDPVSTLSGSRPEVRAAQHLFVDIEQVHGFLETWSQTGGHLQPEIAAYLRGHFLGQPLRAWDVSRPSPYFGFAIPDSPGNYWYVWFDAPIGYIGSTWAWCKQHGEQLSDWWESPDTEIHHFIGKDITYFHTLFWPAMLKVAGFSLPARVHIHGFLTVGGEKMSKSKGTFIMASTYLKHLDPSYLRYYYASKLGPGVDDIDLNLDEFIAKVNSDLVNNVVNLASRTAKFVQGKSLSAAYPDDGGLFAQAAGQAPAIAEAYEAGDYNRAMRAILAVADRANQYIDAQKPWEIAKRGDEAALRDVCTVGINLFRQIAVFLTPVLPELARQTGTLLGKPIQRWEEAQQPLLGSPVGPFEHMMKRVDRRSVDAMVADSLQPEPQQSGAPSAPSQPADGDEALLAEPLTAECTIDDFVKVDLRVARVVAAEDVPEASKLLKLTLSLGGENRRTVFAGIKSAYRPEELVGQLVVCVANLQARKMKFGLSEGMVVASGSGGKDIHLLRPDAGAKPGQRVH